MKQLAIGYDYGTTTSYLSVCDVETFKTTLVCDARGNNRFPSAVFKDEDGSLVFGEEARKHRSKDGFYPSLKHLIKDEKDKTGFAYIALKQFTMTLFSYLNSYLNLTDIDDEVIIYLTATTPLGFRDSANRIIKDVVSDSFKGLFPKIQLKSVTIIPEPLAAAAFILRSKQSSTLGERGYLAVCDMGGGTTDLTLVEYNRIQSREHIISVVQTQSRMDFGGDLITESFRNYLNRQYQGEYSFELSDDIKKKLSKYTAVRGIGEIIISRNEFEENALIKSSFISSLEDLMAGLVKTVQDQEVHIAPIGGSSRIPIIQATYSKFVPKERELILFGEEGEAFDSVVRGAAIYSAYLLSEQSNLKIEGRTSLPLSVIYGKGHLYECVLRNSNDGTYHNLGFHPYEIHPDGTFSLGTFMFYQNSREDEALVKEREPDYSFSLNDNISTGMCDPNEVNIDICIVVKESKLYSCIVTVKIQDKELFKKEILFKNMKRNG